MAIALAVACASTGCDKLFSLQHVDNAPPSDGKEIDGRQIDAGIRPDAACGAPGSVSMIMLGARTGGGGQASMTDTYIIDEPHSGKNYGAAPTLALCAMCDAAGTAWDMSHAVSLLRFDVDAICPGSTIMSAALMLDVTNDQLGSGNVGVFVLRQAWDEGNGSANGTDSVANWNQRAAGAAWTNLGAGAPGSRDATPIATFAPLVKDTSVTIPIPNAVVQAWVNNSASNFGLELAITTGNSDVQFYSRDGGTAAQRPGIAVTAIAP